MGPQALLATAASGIVGAAGWIAHQARALSVVPRAWTCMECHVSNELDRDTCWRCGPGYGQDPLYPSHNPIERPWICMSCAVWNGIAARTARGAERRDMPRNADVTGEVEGSPKPPRGARVRERLFGQS